MAEAIKKFFQKKKLDAKFKLAGTGHRITEQSSPSKTSSGGSSHSQPAPAVTAVPRSQAAQVAGIAALQRIQASSSKPQESRSAQAVKAQAKRELEMQQKRSGIAATSSSAQRPEFVECHPQLTVHGVYFTCPFLGDEVILPRKQLLERLEEFLMGTPYEDDPVFISATMIKTFAQNKEVAGACIKLLQTYVQNILQNPSEQKYQKIRYSNKSLQEKVLPVKGALEFLKAVGFEQMQDEADQFLQLKVDREKSEECICRLTTAVDALSNAEKVPLQLFRDPVVFAPCTDPKSVTVLARVPELPADFFVKDVEEIKREQAELNAAVEKMQILRTKEMRERDEMRRARLYRYVLLRIRFPDGFTLQGTFKSTEKLEDVEQFVKENLANDWVPFQLIDPLGQLLTVGEVKYTVDGTEHSRPRNLGELGLAPASLVTFKYDPSVFEGSNESLNEYLKQELLSMARTVI